jgi:hypothetical protein
MLSLVVMRMTTETITFNFISHKWTEVTFNPYKYDSFVVKATEEPIFFARECIMTPDMKVWVNGKID